MDKRYYLKMSGRPFWFSGWSDDGHPEWADNLSDAFVYNKEIGLLEHDYKLLVSMKIVVVIVRSS